MIRQLPLVTQVTRDEQIFTLTMLIQPTLKYFRGHFDEFPILPGVVQLDWALHYAQEVFEQSFELCGMEVVKYQCPISPNTELLLELVWYRELNKLSFRYFDSQVSYSQGKVKLK